MAVLSFLLWLVLTAAVALGIPALLNRRRAAPTPQPASPPASFSHGVRARPFLFATTPTRTPVSSRTNRARPVPVGAHLGALNSQPPRSNLPIVSLSLSLLRAILHAMHATP